MVISKKWLKPGKKKYSEQFNEKDKKDKKDENNKKEKNIQ